MKLGPFKFPKWEKDYVVPWWEWRFWWSWKADVETIETIESEIQVIGSEIKKIEDDLAKTNNDVAQNTSDIADLEKKTDDIAHKEASDFANLSGLTSQLGNPRLSVLRAGSGTWTPDPARKGIVWIKAVGAGGAGGGVIGQEQSSNCGSAGAAGGYFEGLIRRDKIGSDAISYAVGFGGAGGINDGPSGGTTTFGVFFTCEGGKGGISTGPVKTGEGVWSAQSFGGDISFATGAIEPIAAMRGANGMSGYVGAMQNAAGYPLPPIGANSPLGTGGGNANAGQATSARGYGAGGGAASTRGSQSYAGGSGADGVIIILEY